MAVRRLRKAPVLLYPKGIEGTYRKELLRFVALIEALIKKLILPKLVGWTKDSGIVRADAWPDQVSKLIDNMKIELAKKADGRFKAMSRDVGQKTSKWGNVQWRKTMKQVVGVSLFQKEPWLKDMLSSFSGENVQLIKDIPAKTLTQVDGVVQRGIRSGARVESIRKEIQDVMGATRSRASLIARDQVAKFTGELNKQRQQGLGINEYVWRTSEDERVRTNHRVMNGKICRWDDPTVYKDSVTATRWKKRSGISGVQKHPGQDYQCRCYGEPVFVDVADDIRKAA